MSRRSRFGRIILGQVVVVVAMVVVGLPEARAAVIEVMASDSAEDNIAKIEAAVAGDEVVVHPGTYQFRLYLEGQGTASEPIVIRAADPCDRPVWDLDGDIIAGWPGSYGGGDNGRAIWQITGTYYEITGIVFRNGTDGSGNGGGIRFKLSDYVTLRDCLFQYNDNGIQGAGTNTLVEHCEFGQNGDPAVDEGSHNLYIHGGTITVRYCYIHDARKSQNMHIRANDSVFEYNWIARSRSYMGDMMPCSMDPCSADHTMLLRGNVFVRGTPMNDGQVFVMYNDQGDPNVSFSLTMVHNTIIGNGDGAALVHYRNDTGDIQHESAMLHNNAIYDVARIFRIHDPNIANTTAGGSNNWLSDGTADTTGLSGTITSGDPGFTDAAASNYVPAAGSPLIGGADEGVAGPPVQEYYRDEQLAMMWRDRLTVHDIGALESTTVGDPVGPYGDPLGCGGSGASGTGGSGTGGSGASSTGGSSTGGSGTGGTAPGAADPDDDSGCGCATGPRGHQGWLAAGLVLLVLGRRRRVGT